MGELSHGLPKVAERFIREMVYGIQASQSVVLTKVARMLEEAAEVEGSTVVPLVGRLYSAEAPEFISENREILTVMDRVMGATKKRGMWVIDRGGDRKNLIVPMLQRQYRFLIRLVGTRNLLWSGKAVLAEEIAKDCPMLYSETIAKVDDGREKVYHLEFGYRTVVFPDTKETLWLLVVRGFGVEPMMLLTTEPLRRNRKVLWRLVRAYLRRWAIEDTIRYIKQSYELEDVRVLSYRSLRNMMPLVWAAAFFAAVLLDTSSKLKVMAGYVLKAAKRVFGIPEFHYYCIADGLTSIFARYPGRIVRLLRDSSQIMLFPSSA
jgi:hypothetical protein